MASPPSVFLLGAGYIGRNVLDELLAANHLITTLVRKPEQALELEKSGIRTVLGTLNDTELLTTQTAQHEITINTAICDDLPSVEAILAGVRRRVHKGQPCIYIHTSGTGALEDGALGLFKNEKVFRDDAPDDIEAIPPTSMHRHVDIPIVKAAREFGDKAKIAIILPPLVYGYDPSHKRHSFALVCMARFAVKHGFAGYVGEGQNLWSVIHTKDLSRAYLTLLRHIKDSGPDVLLRNPYFFAENGTEISSRDAAEHISQILYDMGRMEDPKAETWSEAHYQDVFGPLTPAALGSNMRTRAIRLRELGWEPKNSTDIWTSWKEDEIPSILESLDSSTS